jgi:hypothetical protein
MNWEPHLISRAELAAFWPLDEAVDSLHAAAHALLSQQQQTWPQLQTAVAGLQQVEYKEFNIKAATVRAQFNPQRIVSTTAKVDAASISARPCFLCAGNLPAEERGLPFGEQYVVLCNPFPVLPQHLVIAARAHTPQAIADSFGALLALTRALGSKFFTLYNGPRCGASAPDHLHFQAAERVNLPLWRDLAQWTRQRLPSAPGLEVFTLPDYRIRLLGVRGSARAAMQHWFEQAVTALAVVTQNSAEPAAPVSNYPEGTLLDKMPASPTSAEEPLLNLLATFEAGQWNVLLLPRQRHRPACYDAPAEQRLTISPAAIDLGGVIVVPQAEHFARLNAAALTGIYEEVTLSETVFAAWLKKLEQ